MNYARLFRTVRHLKPSQLGWQIWRRFQRQFERPSLLLTQLPTETEWSLGGPMAVDFRIPPVPSQVANELKGRRFRFLNRTEELTKDNLWNPCKLPRLWRYNLHYFDWLWSLSEAGSDGYAIAKCYAIDWMENHKPGKSATGWEPYPSSLRLINWSLLFFGVWREETTQDTNFREQLCVSMWRQYKWLHRHLEYHILANHLLENAVALVVGGKFFEGAFGELLCKVGNRLARDQILEQILPDGMHYERSPMYHARVCWLAKVICQCGDEETVAVVRSKEPGLERAMACMLHSDGEISLFNDAASGIYAVPKDLAAIGKNDGAWSLPDAGYYGFKNSMGDSIVCDCGEVGPDYQPGHTHADTFSFEWTLEGRRFITDTGTFEYDVGPSRSYDRSTAAHNTVSIDGRNSSEVWGGFRVGNRCKPILEKWEPRPSGFELSAEHWGYRPWKHSRAFNYEVDQLVLRDRVEGKGRSEIANYLHFAPEVELEVCGKKAIAVLGDWRIAIDVSGIEFTLEAKRTRYSPQFGVSEERSTLVTKFVADDFAEWSTRIQVNR